MGWDGWLYSDYNASLGSNLTELDWTGTELGNIDSPLVPISILESYFPLAFRL